MNKIGIVTTFYRINDGYSLCSVVKSQINMLYNNGYQPVLITNQNFNGDIPHFCELRKCLPVFKYDKSYTESTVPRDVVESIKTALIENTKDLEICLTHDIIFQKSFTPHNVAVREIEENISWYHWIHSQPTDSLKIKSLPNNSNIIFLNYTDKNRVAKMYNTNPDNVKVVYNAIDPYTPENSSLSKSLINTFVNKDVKIAYSFCTTRMEGKGVKKLIKLASCIKKCGKSIGVIFCNSHATSAKAKTDIKNIIEYSNSVGLNEIIFSSTLSQEYESGVPRNVVRDVFHESNLFIFPTRSECCPLVLLEAMEGGNLLVLNDDLESLKEFGGKDCLYMQFGSNFKKASYKNEDEYYNKWAKIIVEQLNSPYNILKSKNRAKRFYEQRIWDKQLKHLIVTNNIPSKKKVLLIGNGPSAISKEYGEIINNFDGEVVRFNAFETDGYEKWVGDKTDSWVTITRSKKHSGKYFKNIYWATLWPDNKESETFKKFKEDNPLAVRLPHNNVKKTMKEMDYEKPSTGAITAMYFHNNGYDIYLHGFDFMKTKDNNHYFNKNSKRGKHHDPSKEEKFFKSMLDEGKAKWLDEYIEKYE